MTDFSFLSPPKKLLTPIIPVESVIKAQQRVMMLTPAQTDKFKEIMNRNPSGGVSLTVDTKTGQVIHMEKAK